jgi:chemotaxis protein MotB
MRIWALILTAGLAACGVSKDLYEARGQEIDKLKSEIAGLNGQLGEAEDARKRCGEQASTLQKRSASEQAALMKQLEDLKKQAELRAKQYEALMSKLQSMVAAGKLQVEVRNGQLLVKMPDNILFDPGKTDLKNEGKETIKELSKALASLENRKFQVAGHTDDRPLGRKSKYKDNWALSTARAVEVVNYMIKEGEMPAERLSAAGWADQLPVAANADEDGRKQNRRIEIVLLPNIEELPGFDGLKGSK